jgi:CubicO group peptidase (beta-lactamase class C family)
MAPDFNRLRLEVLAATRARILPGAVIAVGQAGKAQFMQAIGYRQVEPTRAPATVDTVYDLASLTKPLVTSVLVMKGVERGVIALEQPLGDFIPALRNRPEATVRLTLAHAAGFPAHRKLYAAWLGQAGMGAARAGVIAQAAREGPVYPPGSRSLYSDLGFILLGDVVERGLGDRLDVLAERLVFRPLGLTNLGFVDLALGPARPGGWEFAPTERCPVRGRTMLGEVHDLNAFVMGGIAGHAGLFGNALDILSLVFELCAAYQGKASPIVATDVLRLFWQPAGIAGSTWRLGWDGPAEHGSLAGDLISRRAVGHLAYTGCSLWIDPEQAICVLVLCNRIHPEAKEDPRFRAFRPAICDAALGALAYRAG